MPKTLPQYTLFNTYTAIYYQTHPSSKRWPQTPPCHPIPLRPLFLNHLPLSHIPLHSIPPPQPHIPSITLTHTYIPSWSIIHSLHTIPPSQPWSATPPIPIHLTITPSLLIFHSPSTSSLHLNLGLPLPLPPSTSHTHTFLVNLLSCISIQ